MLALAPPANSARTTIETALTVQPCLRLTLPQARRLFGLPLAECHRVLEDLRAEKFLIRTEEGRYARAEFLPDEDVM